MAIKKVKSAQKRNQEPVAPAPDLELKRKKFQQAVSSSKEKSIPRKTQPKHHSARKRTLIVIVGALLALFGSVGVVYSYFFWYQTPEKMVSDALTNAVSSRTVSFKAEVNSPTMSLAAIQGSYKDGSAQADAVIRTSLPGELSTINASAMTTSGALYLKVARASKLAPELVPKSQKATVDALMPLIRNSIDDKWVSVTSGDASLFQGVTNVSSCVVDAVRQASVSQQARTLLGQAYLQHAFFTIKEVKTDKNAGTYQLTIDRDTFHTFLDEITNSAASVPFSKCNKEMALVKASSIDTSVVELVIDKTTRTITQATISTSGKDAMTIMVTPAFDQEVTIVEPEDTTNFSIIKAQFLSLFSLTQKN